MKSSSVPRDVLRGVKLVFSDVDGTLTTDGRLRSSTLAAIEALREAGIHVVLVSGRPSGWAECWARQWPVSGAIAENGGLYYAWRGDRLHKAFVQTPAVRLPNRRRLLRIVGAALRAFPGAQLSMDSAATEVDIAIDIAEGAQVPVSQVDAIEAYVRKRGVTAVRSSVHINCWIGTFDKLTASRQYVRYERRTLGALQEREIVFVGDSLNDAPMFAGYRKSFGVGNVRKVWDRLSHRPKFVTRASEGDGFEELAAELLRTARVKRGRGK